MVSVSALRQRLDDLMERLDRITPNRPSADEVCHTARFNIADRMGAGHHRIAMQAITSRTIKPDEAADMVEFDDGRV